MSERKRTIEAFAFSGLQNAHNHLFDDHRILAPEGQQKSKAELASDAITKNRKSTNPESILDYFNLNPENPHEQSFANSLFKNFNREHFQRLVVEWIVDSNLPFSIATDRRLRAIFEYLNPSVKAQKAHITRLKKVEASWLPFLAGARAHFASPTCQRISCRFKPAPPLEPPHST